MKRIEFIKKKLCYVIENCYILERTRKMKKNRELKVYESNGTYGSVTPLIRLQGKWVKDAGFEKLDEKLTEFDEEL